MKEEHGIGLFGCLGVGMLLLIGLSVIFGAFGFGFATGGGSIENDLFSPDSEATCEGSNCTIVAVSGRSNHVSVAVDQYDEGLDEDDAGRGALSVVMVMFIVGVVFVIGAWVFRPSKL